MLGLSDLADIAAEHAADLEAEVHPFDLARQIRFPSAQPAVMGVINLSADSWYRESICSTVESAVERGLELRGQGADIIDIGAESTLGQARRVVPAEQQQQLLPVVEQLAADGIRVNTVHPNAVFDTAIWTDEVLEGRAAHYGMSVEDYRRNNLLRQEVTSNDVAAMVCAVAGSAFRCTTGAQLPIDGGNERVV